MLRKFAVANFKNFKDRIVLDLSRHRNYEFNDFAIRGGIIKDGIVYGRNGCGKSNLGIAIFDIINHLSQNMKDPHHYSNAVYAGNPEGYMRFEYSFDFPGLIVDYSYAKDSRNALKEEYLSVNGQSVFSRNGDSLDIDRTQFALTDENIEALGRNSNNISIINFLVASFPLTDDHYLNQLIRFVNSMLWFRCLEGRGFMGLLNQGESLMEYIIKNDLAADFSDFLKDVSKQEFVFAAPKKDDKELFCLIEGKRMPFSATMSTGTSSLLLFYFWLKHLDGVSFLFIDEFDAFYHFELAAAICRKLFQQECQVLLTSHNTYLMGNDILRPDCNFILKDNRIRALCDCTPKDLRYGHNIEKLFRGGAFDL